MAHALRSRVSTMAWDHDAAKRAPVSGSEVYLEVHPRHVEPCGLLREGMQWARLHGKAMILPMVSAQDARGQNLPTAHEPVQAAPMIGIQKKLTRQERMALRLQRVYRCHLGKRILRRYKKLEVFRQETKAGITLPVAIYPFRNQPPRLMERMSNA